MNIFYYICKNKLEMERYSMKEVLKQKFGEPEKSKKTARNTQKSKKRGNYNVKIVDGVKYLTLK